MADLARSIGFLSRLPVPDRFFRGYDGSVSRAVRAFPLAGLVVAALPALLLFLALQSGNSFLAAFLALALQALLTGALHEDGLADTADGLGGGRDKEHALLIMKDSRVGTYGVIALILSFGLRASALSALSFAGSDVAALAMLATAAFSRAAMVLHWKNLPSARDGGVAANAGAPEQDATTIALGIGLVVGLALLLPVLPVPPVVFAIIAGGLAAYAFTRFTEKKLGGHTGDTIGAAQQLTEIAMLAALALAV